MLRSVLAILAVLLLGAAGAGAYWKFVMVPGQQQVVAPGRGGPGGPVAVEAQAVRVGPAETSLDAVGTLISNELVVLRPEVSGRVANINFDEGGMVPKGRCWSSSTARSSVPNSPRPRRREPSPDSNFERASELRRNNAGTQRALDEAEAGMRTADAAVDLAQARLDKRKLIAPFDSRAGLRNVSPGAFVTSDTEIVNLEQIDPIKVDFRVPELFLPTVVPGQRITVEIDAFPGEPFVGQVKALNPLVDATGRAIVVRAEVSNVEAKLRPGLFARVHLQLAERQNALFVPEQAIQPQGDRAFVFKVVDPGDGKTVARQTAVALGQPPPR